MEAQQWIDWAAAHPWLVVTVAATLLSVAWMGGAEIAARRRCSEIVRALNDSTRGSLRPAGRNGRLRLRASLEPPPEPFAHFEVDLALRARSGFPRLLGLFGLRRQQLALFGALRRRPMAEVVWEQGRDPERALGRSPASSLWRSHRLDYLSGAYAVHGVNTSALEHAFIDLQTRFGPSTRRIVVQANTMPQVVVVLSLNGLNSQEIPALITTVCTLARASLVQ